MGVHYDCVYIRWEIAAVITGVRLYAYGITNVINQVTFKWLSSLHGAFQMRGQAKRERK